MFTEMPTKNEFIAWMKARGGRVSSSLFRLTFDALLKDEAMKGRFIALSGECAQTVGKDVVLKQDLPPKVKGKKHGKK